MAKQARAAVAAIAAALAVIGVDPSVPAAHADPGGSQDADVCSLVQESLEVVDASPDSRTELFANYGDTSGNWIGADSTYSVTLKNGDVTWLFSDSVFGSVTDGQVEMDTMSFLNNSFIRERDGKLVETISGWDQDARTSIFAPPTPESWYWLGAGYVAPNGKLAVGLNRYDKFGSGIWDWTWAHSAIATVDTSSWVVDEITPVNVNSDVQWTSWYERAEGKTYIFGVHDQGALKQAHVARVAGHDLTRIDNWEYWTGKDWTHDASLSAPIQDHVANEYSVTKFRDGYLLVTQDTSEAFSTSVVAYTSCSPVGPFDGKTVLFDTPETGAAGTYQDPNIFTYNAHVHPEFSTEQSLLISYNVNTFDSEQVFEDVTIYRPRFWTIKLA